MFGPSITSEQNEARTSRYVISLRRAKQASSTFRGVFSLTKSYLFSHQTRKTRDLHLLVGFQCWNDYISANRVYEKPFVTYITLGGIFLWRFFKRMENVFWDSSLRKNSLSHMCTMRASVHWVNKTSKIYSCSYVKSYNNVLYSKYLCFFELTSSLCFFVPRTVLSYVLLVAELKRGVFDSFLGAHTCFEWTD